jgi:hypothetical protein
VDSKVQRIGEGLAPAKNKCYKLFSNIKIGLFSARVFEMKIKVTKSDGKSSEFPKLMKYTGRDSNFVVLFSSNAVGMVVESQDDERPVGYFDDCWTTSRFCNFQGSVTLENGT